MASVVSSNGHHLLTTDTIEWVTADIQAALLDSRNAVTATKAVVNLSELTADEVDPADMSGYARVALANKAIDNVGDRSRYTADQVVFPTLGTSVAARNPNRIVIFDNAGGADTARKVIAVLDFTPTPSNGANYPVNQPTNGWVNINNP